MAAKEPVAAHKIPVLDQWLPVRLNPATRSRHVTPTVIAGTGAIAAAAVAYSSSNRSESGTERPELRPRRANAPKSPRSPRDRSALAAPPVDNPVVSRTALTVAVPPHSNASATASTAGVQRGGLGGACTGRPLLETIKDLNAISAAPVSSTQPTPSAESVSRAPGDMRRATTTSGRPLRSAINSRAWRNPPSPIHLTFTSIPLNSRLTV